MSLWSRSNWPVLHNEFMKMRGSIIFFLYSINVTDEFLFVFQNFGPCKPGHKSSVLAFHRMFCPRSHTSVCEEGSNIDNSYLLYNAKIFLCLVNHHVMKASGEWMYISTPSKHLHQPVYSWEREFNTPVIGALVGSRANLDAMEKREIFYSYRESNLGSPARSSLL
jgi:hypothetical protein